MYDDDARPVNAEPALPYAVPVIPMARPISADAIAEASANVLDPMLLGRTQPRDAWIDIALLILLVVFFELLIPTLFSVGLGLQSGVRGEDIEPLVKEAWRQLLVPMLFLRAGVAGAIVYVIVRRRRQSAGSVGIAKRRLLLNSLIGIAAAPGAYAVMGIAVLIMWLISSDLVRGFEKNAEQLMSAIPPMHPLMFVPLSIAIGFYEELLFRGFLMTRLRRATNSWTLAVVLSTATFTALHAFDQTGVALGAITLLALLFSGLTIWRRSIVPAIWAHTLWNLSQFLLLYNQAGDMWQ